MIYGNVNNPMFEDQAAVLPDALSAALHFLKETDLAAHEPGVFNIELGGVSVILQVLDLTTSPREALRPKNIDVQFLAAGGPELAAYYDDDGTNKVDEDLLDTPRDILFYKNNAAITEGRIPMTVGTYAMYFPWDVHVPAIQAGDAPAAIRKIVIKVPLDACRKGE